MKLEQNPALETCDPPHYHLQQATEMELVTVGISGLAMSLQNF